MASPGWRSVGIVTFVAAALLLVSFGGAIVAAPLTLPLLHLVSQRHPTRTFRLGAVVIGGLTVVEVAWAATYVTLGEGQPWIWLVPACCGVLAARVYAAPAAPLSPDDDPGRRQRVSTRR